MILPGSTPFLADSGAQHVCAMLEDAGYEAFFVGGCVRNAVMGQPASDIDISTNARPNRVMEMAESFGLKAVPTGIDHGTVTVIAGGTPYEVTTYRRDVETDGRRAVVAFSKNIDEDARRRDFTMNAIYASRDGRLVDPLGGLIDARAGRVVFIEDAARRIREDYLRTLRFFRFWAYYADQSEGFDPEALAAISATLDGLEKLSAERVGAEMLKLLSAPDPSVAIATMAQVGVLARVMPVASTEVLPRLVHLETHSETRPDPIRRLSALGAEDATERLRLSKRESRSLTALTEAAGSARSAKALGFLLGSTRGWDAVLLRAATLETPMDPKWRNDVTHGSDATFPIKASDIDLHGPALGAKLKLLREEWLTSELTLTKRQLLG